jgi:superfamily I DNA/RNA helicase
MYDEIFPLYGLQAIEETGERFDVVLVDEAQDFDPDVISTLVRAWTGDSPEASIAFFGDFSRQAIYGQSPDALRKLRDLLGSAGIISLTRNCRNSRRIALQTSYLSRFDGYRNLEGQPDGDAVDVRFYRSEQDEAFKFAQIMNDLNREGIPAKDIVILGKRRLENWKAAKQASLPWNIVEASDVNDFSVPYSTIHAFKGLEAPVIILVHVDALDDNEESLLYVGMSRARARLYMLIDESCRRAHDQKVAVGMARALSI